MSVNTLASATNENHKSQLETVEGLLGSPAVLIPIPSRQKRPVIKGWQETTQKQMEDVEYLAALEKSPNLGVLLGAPSDGLCTIDIDSDDEVEPFLALNPILRDSLRTKGSKGEQIWIRTTDYPTLTKLTKDGKDWGEWRATGGQSVIAGVHPLGMRYRFVNEAQPLSVPFSEIKWPEGIKLPWVKNEYEQMVADFGEPYTTSESGSVQINSRFFVEKFRKERHVLYESTLGEFFVYDSDVGVWKPSSIETIKRQFLNDITKIARDQRLQKMHHLATDATAGALVAMLKSLAERREAFSTRQTMIHVQNGVIKFSKEGVTLETVTPDCLSRNICPSKYDPKASSPRFLDELLRPALSEDDIKLLQKWCGAVLMGVNEAQRMLIITGTAGGGKSTLMNVLEEVIGNANVAELRTDCLSNPFEMYAFVGKTLLSGKDVSADFLQEKGATKLKALIGGDLMHAEKKGSNQRIAVRGNFNVGITCNADLNVRLEGDVEAWRRRLLIVRYDRKTPVERRIPNFAGELLEQEGDGILKWMVDGAIALKNDLASHGDFVFSNEQKDRVAQILEQSDSVRVFVRDGVEKRNGHSLSMKQLQDAYFEFCEERGWQPMHHREFGSQLKRSMLEVHKMSDRHDVVVHCKSQRGYKHLAIVGKEDAV